MAAAEWWQAEVDGQLQFQETAAAVQLANSLALAGEVKLSTASSIAKAVAFGEASAQAFLAYSQEVAGAAQNQAVDKAAAVKAHELAIAKAELVYAGASAEASRDAAHAAAERAGELQATIVAAERTYAKESAEIERDRAKATWKAWNTEQIASAEAEHQYAVALVEPQKAFGLKLAEADRTLGLKAREYETTSIVARQHGYLVAMQGLEADSFNSVHSSWWEIHIWLPAHIAAWNAYFQTFDALDATTEFFSGFADVLTAGLTARFREAVGFDAFVNMNSPLYGLGNITGQVFKFVLIAASPGPLCSPETWYQSVLQGYATVMDVVDRFTFVWTIGRIGYRLATEGKISSGDLDTLVMTGVQLAAHALRSSCLVAGTGVVVGREQVLVWDHIGDEPGEPGFGVVFGATIVVAGAVALAADEIGALRRGASRKKKRADEEEVDDLFGGQPIDWREPGEPTGVSFSRLKPATHRRVQPATQPQAFFLATSPYALPFRDLWRDKMRGTTRYGGRNNLPMAGWFYAPTDRRAIERKSPSPGLIWRTMMGENGNRPIYSQSPQATSRVTCRCELPARRRRPPMMANARIGGGGSSD